MITAKATINGSRLKKGRISPHIFGNFIEDINDHMDAMLSFPLRNMDFQEEDDKENGVSGCWYKLGKAKNAIYSLEPAAPKHSGHSQKIELKGYEEECVGLGQKVSVKGNKNYFVKVYARATSEIKDVWIYIVDLKTQERIGEVKINIGSHSWNEYTTVLFIERDCTDAEFRLSITSPESLEKYIAKGMLWLDHVSIFPQDSIGLVKREVFNMAKDLNSGIMRFGGNEISSYHWEEGIGPFYERSNKISEAWGHWTNKYFGTDEFLSLCHDLKVEPLVCVNVGSGTPEEAARWVEYCNGDIDTPMGKLRAKNGNVNPYKVKYWEIGNEMYGDWQIGHSSAEEYGEKYLAFYYAMKAVDPDIILLGCGSVNQEWNETVLGIAGSHMDYLTMHFYHRLKAIGVNDSSSNIEKFNGMVGIPEIIREIIHQTTEMIKGCDKYSHVRLAITEYNVFYNNLSSDIPGNHTLEAAIVNASIINELIRNANMIEIANYSDLVNGWQGGCIRVPDEYYSDLYDKAASWTGGNLTVYGIPVYHALKMYASKDITFVTECNVHCDTFDVRLGELDEESENHPVIKSLYQFAKAAGLKKLPVLDMVSCLNENKNILTTFIINRSFKDTLLTIDLLNFDFTQRRINVITSDDINDINDANKPNRIICQNDNQKNEELIIKAHSIYAVEFIL